MHVSNKQVRTEHYPVDGQPDIIVTTETYDVQFDTFNEPVKLEKRTRTNDVGPEEISYAFTSKYYQLSTGYFPKTNEMYPPLVIFAADETGQYHENMPFVDSKINRTDNNHWEMFVVDTVFDKRFNSQETLKLAENYAIAGRELNWMNEAVQAIYNDELL